MAKKSWMSGKNSNIDWISIACVRRNKLFNWNIDILPGVGLKKNKLLLEAIELTQREKQHWQTSVYITYTCKNLRLKFLRICTLTYKENLNAVVITKHVYNDGSHQNSPRRKRKNEKI